MSLAAFVPLLLVICNVGLAEAAACGPSCYVPPFRFPDRVAKSMPYPPNITAYFDDGCQMMTLECLPTKPGKCANIYGHSKGQEYGLDETLHLKCLYGNPTLGGFVIDDAFCLELDCRK